MKYEKEFKTQAVALSQKIGVRRAAQQLEIPYHTLEDWRRKTNRFGKANAFSINGMKREETVDWKGLEKQNNLLLHENEILRQVLQFFSGPKEATLYLRYRFIWEHRDLGKVSELCRVLDVSENGYYRYVREQEKAHRE